MLAARCNSPVCFCEAALAVTYYAGRRDSKGGAERRGIPKRRRWLPFFHGGEERDSGREREGKGGLLQQDVIALSRYSRTLRADRKYI